MNEVMSVMAHFALVDSITGPLKSIYASLVRTEGGVSRLQSSLGNLTKRLLPFAAAAAIVLAAFVPGIATAASFEAAMSQVGAVSRATAAEMGILEQAALDLGASTAWSASQVAEAEKYLAMAGFSVQQNVAALPGVLNLASAGATDLGRAADVASDILSAFGLQATEMNRVADTLTATFTTANVNLEMLADTMKYVGPVAAKVGLSLAETAAMAGLLGNVGIKGSQAGTTLRAMLTRLAAPSGEAAKMLQSLGVSAMDASGNLRSPITILGELATAMEGMGTSKQMAALKTLFDAEAMAGVAELLGKEGMGGITKYLAIVKDSAGAASEVAGRQLDNLTGAATILGSAWEGLQITIGKVFLPILTVLTNGLATVVSWLNALASTTAGKYIIGLAGALATGVVAVTAFTAAMWAVTVVAPLVTAALSPVVAAIAAISWPVWLAIAAVAALWLAFKTNFGGIADFVGGVWDKISLVVSGVRAVLSSLQGGIGAIKGQLASDIEAAGLLGMVTSVARAIYRVSQLFSGLAEGVGTAFVAIWDAIGPVITGLFSAFGPLVDLVGKWAQALFGATAATDVSGWRLLGQVVGTVVAYAFKALGVAIRVATLPLQILSTIIRSVSTALNSGSWREAGVALVTTFIDGIRSAGSALYSAFLDMLGPLGKLLPHSDAQAGPLSTLTASGQALLGTFGAGIAAAAPGLVDTTASAMSGVADAMAIPAAPQVDAPSASAGFGPADPLAGFAPQDVALTAPAQADETKSRGAAPRKNGASIVIQNLTLPGVTDAESFVRQLQGMVEAYDGC
ncbi:MAG: phage tail tape measure protein [Desulfovibrionaceae bacterium]